MTLRTSVYHPGEMKIQELAGVRDQAEVICQIVHTSIPAIAREFLAKQRWVLVASRAEDGRLWCSLLTGCPGFLSAPNQHTVRIESDSLPGDPLTRNLGSKGTIGLLAIDFFTRRRMKVKGEAERSDETIILHVHQVFSICHKYIQQREPTADAPGGTPSSRHDIVLEASQRDWISNSDTFFIATYNADSGLNAGHRGGRPGFVHVLDNRTIRFPDYPGNNMFNTLGNLVLDPRAGLLFLDFEHGDTMQITGCAEVFSDPSWLAEFPGARFVVEFAVDQVIQTHDATNLRWRLLDYSPYDPTP